MTAPASRRLGSAPAKPALAGLTVLVLVGHWFALGGQLPAWWVATHGAADATALADASTSPAASPPTTGAPPAPPPQALPAPVTTSTVRWIVPAPPTPPEPEPPPPPSPPIKVAKKPPPPPLPTTPATPEPIEPIDETVIEALVDNAPSYQLPVEPLEGLQGLEALEAEVPAEAGAPNGGVTVQPIQKPGLADIEIAKAVPTARDAAHGDAGAAAPLPLAQLPPSARLRYDVASKVKGFTFNAGGQLNWRQDGSTYEARLEISAFLLGSIVQTSTGRVSPTGLAPDRFSDKRRSEKSAEFDHTTQRIRYSNNARIDPLLAGAQDQVSISLQLAGLLNANPQYTQGQTISLPVSGASSSETWRFDIGPEATLNLPAGPMLTRILTRQPRHGGDKKIQIWLAPTLENLPVRIRISESNGDFIDQSLEEIPSLSAAAPSS